MRSDFGNNTLIAIGIVSFERGDLTRRCIDSIRSCTCHGTYHIFLVDNRSQTASAKEVLNWCRIHDDISVRILESNYGPSYARNIIIEMIGANYPMVAFFDNDIVALPSWSEAALRAIEHGADLIQPKLLNADGYTVERGPTIPRDNPLSANPEFLGIGMDSSDQTVNTPSEAAIVGTASIIRREVFDRIGGYDDRLHIGEDFDHSYRAKKAGFVLRYIPDCALIHDHGFDFEYDQIRGSVEKYLRSHVFFWRKHQRALLSPQYLCWYGWLYFNNEPMYMPQQNKWKTMHRRLRRRLMMKWCMTHYQNAWNSVDEANKATEVLAMRLGL
jgi:GT2 family glycosyltransferase